MCVLVVNNTRQMNNDDYTTRPTGSSTADKGEIFICVPRIIPPIVIAWKMMVGGGGLFQGGGATVTSGGGSKGVG